MALVPNSVNSNGGGGEDAESADPSNERGQDTAGSYVFIVHSIDHNVKCKINFVNQEVGLVALVGRGPIFGDGAWHGGGGGYM